MGLIWTALVGLIAGAIAKMLMPGKDPGGCIITMLLGIAGAFVGGFLAELLGIGAMGGLMGLIFAVLGAVILLALYRLIRRNT